MRNKIKKNIVLVHTVIILFVILLEFFLLSRNKYILGSDGDWFIQSTSFYEYFRNLFYETGELFPDLALHIGGGQNIYYFAYYGLFSPYLILFYLFPFVNAGDYIVITSVLNVIVSAILLYMFLLRNNYSNNLSLFGSLMYSCGVSLVIYSLKEIMFVQYMTFLVLGLLGTKKYLDDKKSFLLVVSVFLIIITSYYFSIPSLICMCIYALYYYVKKFVSGFKLLIKSGLCYLLRILLGILLSSFLLLPLMHPITSRMETFSYDISLVDFLINSKDLMYNASGVGLTAIVWLGLFYNMLFLKKENKVLSIILFIIVWFPFINLILNGFLYFHGKVFIPFVILFIILILDMIKKTEKNKIFSALIISSLSSLIILKFEDNISMIIFYIDLVITFLLLLIHCKKNKIIYIYGVVIIMFCITIYDGYKNNYLLTNREYNFLYNIIDFDIKSYVDDDNLYRTDYVFNDTFVNYSDASSIYTTSLYSSTYNETYRNIYYDVFNNSFKSGNRYVTLSQKNLFFEKFMGVRYLVTNHLEPFGYEKIVQVGDIDLYKNKNVYSIGFGSSNLINYEEYKELSFIEKLQVYINNIIIDGESSNPQMDMFHEEIKLKYLVKNNNINILKTSDGYMVDSKNDGFIDLELEGSLVNKTLVIRFKVDNNMMCKNHDNGYFSIRINGINNSSTCNTHVYHNNNKTFDYVISSNDPIKELNIILSKGKYEITDIETYVVDNEFFIGNDTIPLNIKNVIKDNVVYGNIDMPNDGYFMFTIPYDKGYTAYIDNKEVEIEQVNEGFIGFKLNKGVHDIKLVFEAPFSSIGRLFSLIGLIMVIILNIYEKKMKIMKK